MSPRLARPVRLKIYSRVAGWGEEAFPIHSLKMKRGANNGRFSPYLQVCFIILLVDRVGVRQYVRIKYSKKAFSSFRIFPFFRTTYGTVRPSTVRWQSDKQKKGTANQPGKLACVEKDRSIPYQYCRIARLGIHCFGYEHQNSSNGIAFAITRSLKPAT